MNPSFKHERVFASLGSNCADAPQMLEKAAGALDGLEGVRLAARSSLYFTEPQDYKDQPWFANQVVEIALTAPSEPQELLEKFLRLESSLGRKRDPALRFGPRVIDIDLLLFGRRIGAGFCALPHPRLVRRAFALVPLREIAPDVLIFGKTPAGWLAKLSWSLEGARIRQEA